jgi:hypothetical protein
MCSDEQRAVEREAPRQESHLGDLAERPATAEHAAGDDAVVGGGHYDGQGAYLLTGVSHAATLASERRRVQGS